MLEHEQIADMLQQFQHQAAEILAAPVEIVDDLQAPPMSPLSMAVVSRSRFARDTRPKIASTSASVTGDPLNEMI